jgi:hypothetical protein
MKFEGQRSLVSKVEQARFSKLFREPNPLRQQSKFCSVTSSDLCALCVLLFLFLSLCGLCYLRALYE